jgi:hypothetical protein
VFKDIADARARLAGGRTPQEKIQANQQLDTSAISRLLVIAENYPQLKSNENFLQLQDELAGTENRIAVERRKYNEALQRYNTSIAAVPQQPGGRNVGPCAQRRVLPDRTRSPHRSESAVLIFRTDRCGP